jgi:hypothetical protein
MGEEAQFDLHNSGSRDGQRSQGTSRPIEGVDSRQSTDPRGVDEGGAPTGPVLRAVGPSVGRNLHSAMRPQMRLQAESRLAPRAID